MPHTFSDRLDALAARLIDQGTLVLQMVEGGFDHLFAPGQDGLDGLRAAEDTVDAADVGIEKAAVTLLGDATDVVAGPVARGETDRLPDADLRRLLTIVKVNNELERIADAALACATLGQRLADTGTPPHNAPPTTFRVLTNSVVGIVRDAMRAMGTRDARLARVVLQSDEAVEAFKAALMRECEAKLRGGDLDATAAFLLLEIATTTHAIAEHAANIAEQLLYLYTGTIVRHVEGRWQEVEVGKEGNGG
ncbi:MAG: phosphate signaling complex PhoU family protein [Phycisphaerales bacterium JB060]